MSKLIVTIEEGQLQGKQDKDYLGGTFLSFQGIPYAEPPIGDLRFRAPVPKKPWKGVLDATEEGPECPALHISLRTYIGSEENCLHLTVHTKELPKSGPLKPVMVWIHGGAFVLGSNKRQIYGPEYLLSEDIVLVKINYRLGILGFLSLEDVSLGVPGNAGMKDMILALKWVQKNIKHFNGDPKNVTIFGQSAGGASVHYLYLSPLSKGLFHKAIVQSGTALSCWACGSRNGKTIANCLNYKETDEKKILRYLRSLPAKKLIKAQSTVRNVTSHVPSFMAPVVEKPSHEPAFLLEQPIDIIKNGTFNNVPIMMGYASMEALLYLPFIKRSPSKAAIKNFETEIPQDLYSNKSKEMAKKIEDFYLGDGKLSVKEYNKQIVLLRTDTHFAHGTHRSVSIQKQTSSAPVYLYRMNLETSLNFYKQLTTTKCPICFMLLFCCSFKCGCGLCRKFLDCVPSEKIQGNAHADDLPYLFKPFWARKLKRGSIEEISVRRFVKLWTNFARTGNPTPDKIDPLLNVEWKPASKENYYLEIGRELKVGSNPDAERMKFWDSLYVMVSPTTPPPPSPVNKN